VAGFSSFAAATDNNLKLRHGNAANLLLRRTDMKTASSKAKSTFVRRMQILTALAAGRGHTAAELSRLFGVSRRTLFRDLKEIRNIGIQPLYCRSAQTTASKPEIKTARLGEGAEQTTERIDSPSRSRGGYTIASGASGFLPPVNLNLQEALGLLLLAHKVRPALQMPFKHSVLLAALKIESSLPPRVRRYCEHALEKISAKVAAQAVPLFAQTEEGGLDNIFSTLQSALAQRRKVHIHYDSLFDAGIIDCELSPYHLFYNQRAWYVVGYSSVHKTIRTFKLNRIKDVVILDEQFANGDNFDLAEYIGRAWSMIPEGRIYNVRLRFTPKVANNVAEVQWHSTQKVTRNADGSAVLEFRVDGLGEITWWILGYGDQVEVLAPAILRSKIVEIARKMIWMNNETVL
jgi:proteasome accessory factor B